MRITLTVIDERGQEVTYSTDARIQMTEKVDYRAGGAMKLSPSSSVRAAARRATASAAWRC